MEVKQAIGCYIGVKSGDIPKKIALYTMFLYHLYKVTVLGVLKEIYLGIIISLVYFCLTILTKKRRFDQEKKILVRVIKKILIKRRLLWI